jgi:diaminopimelate epimerase
LRIKSSNFIYSNVEFIKMHGCGNDYIFIDCFNGTPARPTALARRLSDRHTGVGGDGLVLMERSARAHAKMRIFNADGSEARMCGNAIRCMAKYLFESGNVPYHTFNIETKSGVKRCSMRSNTRIVCVDMGPVQIRGDIVSVGNPHRPILCKDVDAAVLGPHLGNEVNTEFFQILGPNHIKMRVWERGSGETRACGTGATATAAMAVKMNLVDPAEDIKVQMPGGTLDVIIRPEGKNYRAEISGPAATVFVGEIK